MATVKALYFGGIIFFSVFHINISSLEFNFVDFEFVMLQHGQNAHVVFNFVETIRLRNLQNKSHTKFKGFTVFQNKANLYYLKISGISRSFQIYIDKLSSRNTVIIKVQSNHTQLVSSWSRLKLPLLHKTTVTSVF